MIVLDGSALFSILLGEPEGVRCEEAIEEADTLLMSAGSLSEVLIAAAGKEVLEEMSGFIQALAPTIVPLTEARARSAARAYVRWGKGFHSASSISATASPTRLPRSTTARSSSSGATSL